MGLTEDTFQKIARIISTRFDIQVKIQGSMAGVNLKEGLIILPAVSESQASKVENILDGYLDHEVGHVRYSSEEVDANAKKTSYYRLWNVFEVSYVEREITRGFPGCGQNITRMNEVLYQEAAGRWDKMSPGGKILTLALIAMSGGDIAGFPKEGIAGVWDRFEKKGFIERGRETKSSKECFALAKELHEFFQKEKDTHQEEAQDKSGDSEKEKEGEGKEGEGTGGKQEGEGEESGEGKKGEDGGNTSKEEQSADASEAGKPTKENCAGKGSEYASGEEFELGDASDALTADVLFSEKIAEEKAGLEPSSYVVFSTEWDKDFEYNQDARIGFTAAYKRLQDKVQAYIGAMGASLELALAAVTQSHWVGGQDRGRKYDRRRMVSWACDVGDDGIYRDRIEGERLDTAVLLLWDCSGSMRNGEGSKSELAAIAAVAFHESLLRANVPHEVLGFNTQIKCPDGLKQAWRDAMAGGDNKWRYSRRASIDKRMVFVPFGQSDGRAIAAIRGEGENRDGEAVLWAARRLACRKERRKVLIVGSDGEPAGAEYGKLEEAYLRETVQRVIKSGIEVYGIGIMSMAVQSYYPTYQVVNQVQDIPRAVISVLSGYLQSGKGKNHAISHRAGSNPKSGKTDHF